MQQRIDELDFLKGVFIDRLFLHPIGPYWYLQTLITCGVSYILVFHLVPMKTNSRIILLGIIFHMISNMLGVMSFACSLYFLAGVVLRQSGISFTDVFQQSPIAILAFILLAIHPQNLLLEASGGVLMVYLVIVGFLFVHSHAGKKANSLLTFLGRNTMPLFLFSPIFTFLCKPLASVSCPENGYGYNCNHVTFMIVEIVKLFYMPINGRTFWKKLGTFLAERWHESRSFMPIKSRFP